MFKVLEENNFLPRLLHLARIYINSEGKIKTFLDNQNLSEICVSIPIPKEILQGFFIGKRNGNIGSKEKKQKW